MVLGKFLLKVNGNNEVNVTFKSKNLEPVKYLDLKSRQLIATYCRCSIKSLRSLYAELLSEGIEYILVNRLSQDGLENFFSELR